MTSIELVSSKEDYPCLPGIATGGANGVYTPPYFDGDENPLEMVKPQLNGRYLNLVQPYRQHEYASLSPRGIDVYSFCLPRRVSSMQDRRRYVQPAAVHPWW
jgi:hypothetical protein